MYADRDYADNYDSEGRFMGKDEPFEPHEFYEWLTSNRTIQELPQVSRETQRKEEDK
jgi:hypothetical protein